jgi:hypothetical protein
MNALLSRVVFSVESEQYRWDDVILFARLRGDWANVKKELREGLACIKRLEDAEEEIDPGALQSAANDFRYERNLISAEEAEAWLRDWDLGAEAWIEYLRRLLLRRKWADQLTEILARYPVAKEEIRSHLQVEAVCSGHLGRFARALAAQASARAKVLEAGWIQHEDKGAKATGRMRILEAGYRCFCDHAVDALGLKNQVDAHRLDWIKFDCRYVLFSQEQMAREAILCAREDRIPLDAIAANANVAVQSAAIYLDAIEPSQRDRFLSAERGGLIGPLDWDGAVGVFLIKEKIIPTVEDPEVKQRAAAALLQSALDREINNRVKWHARL